MEAGFVYTVPNDTVPFVCDIYELTSK